MVQRAQLVEDTMAKVEGMRGKDNSKPVFVKKGAPNIALTFRNNNINNNNKRPNTGRDVARDKRVKVEGRKLAENCKFCDKLGHRAEECWKKLGACLKCGGRDHRIPDCPMLKDQPGRAQNVPRDEFRTCWGRVEELLVAGELWIIHNKLIFFPRSSATTCTNRPLEVDQSTLCQYKVVLDRNPMPCPFPVVLWHKAIATERTVAIGSRQDMSSRSAVGLPEIVVFPSYPCRDLPTCSVMPVATCTRHCHVLFPTSSDPYQDPTRPQYFA
ncbi:hypothetical protein Taro_000933 [Colocasia esculenta]|uniref:CCHC-type domain-containing protein n=1 Tax=Colocasia esculenta TaxID=4460 RepID=A0A843TGL6_COLES|nr:hypothetical protein [Colocasia esculenta]